MNPSHWIQPALLGPLLFTCLFPLFAAAETQPEFGFSPVEAYQLKQSYGDTLLFVDVRDPLEIQFTGFSDVVDLNIPLLVADRSAWNEQRNRFQMVINEDFIEQIRKALEQRGPGSDAMIITLCRSGSARGEPSAELLRAAGLTNAHFVINGFEGAIFQKGPLKGHRLKNG